MQGIALTFAAAAAILGVVAARIAISDNIDQFMDDMQWQGLWNSLAAICAAVAAGTQVFDRLFLVRICEYYNHTA